MDSTRCHQTSVTGVSNTVSPGVLQFFSGQPYNSSQPKAYLNWILFDEQMQYVSANSSAIQVSSAAASGKELLSTLQNISKSGYLYVYVSNESPQDVYFDDLSVKHFTGPLLQEQSYYPFGLEMQGLSSKAFNKLTSQYKFNGGVELEEELNIYSTFYRQYDQQIGRFTGVDIMSEKTMSAYGFGNNNPTMFMDPMGDLASSTSSMSAGDLFQYITNMMNFGITSTDNMFDFGGTGNNAFSWDYSSSGSDGSPGISFGFNANTSNGVGGFYQQTIEETVRAYVLEAIKATTNDERWGFYDKALNKITSSYGDVFVGAQSIFVTGNIEEANVFWKDNTEAFQTISTEQNGTKYGWFEFSTGAFNAFAKRSDPYWSFGELTRTIYHEYYHYNDLFGLNGHPELWGSKYSKEREFRAYYNMHTVQGLPNATHEAIFENFYNGIIDHNYYQGIPQEHMTSAYSTWYIQMSMFLFPQWHYF